MVPEWHWTWSSAGGTQRLWSQSQAVLSLMSSIRTTMSLRAIPQPGFAGAGFSWAQPGQGRSLEQSGVVPLSFTAGTGLSREALGWNSDISCAPWREKMRKILLKTAWLCLHGCHGKQRQTAEGHFIFYIFHIKWIPASHGMDPAPGSPLKLTQPRALGGSHQIFHLLGAYFTLSHEIQPEIQERAVPN